mgnify:FL=1
MLLYVALIAVLLRTGFQLWQAGERYGPFILLLVLVYAVQNFFVFDTAMTLWFLLVVLSSALARLHIQAGASAATVSSLRFSTSRAIPIAAGVAVLILLYPVALQPLRANLALAQGYLYHVFDVERAVGAMERGLSLSTYADIEYGYQAYSMYTDQQQHMLKGQERVTAYRYALDVLTKNYERYPYDARTATYLAHVLDSAPPEEQVDEEFLLSVIARAVELSPKRAQAKYILANISLKKGDKAQGAEQVRYYREGIAILEKYATEVTNLAETNYIIANLYLVLREPVLAKKWADEGLALYKEKGGSGASSRAIKYYIAVEDWPNALFFMKGVVDERGNNFEEIYDLAKLYFLNGDREHAVQLVERLRRESPGLVETDPEFQKAIGF